MHTTQDFIWRVRFLRLTLCFMPRRARARTAEQTDDPAVLQALSHDRGEQVRRAVAQNCASSELTLLRLAQPQQPHIVRLSLAHQRTAPIAALETLANDHHSNIRAAVAANPRTPESILEELAEDVDDTVRHNVAANKRTPKPVRARLAGDACAHVRIGAASNPLADTEAIAVLSTDRSTLVSTLARSHKRYNPGHASK